jgi:hypothetical protein
LISLTELLPASSPEDYPKIIKSGIDEEGQHPKSPAITGPCGIATLLHRIGRLQLLERLLDVEGTKEFDLRVRTGEEYLLDVYVQRRGNNVEVNKTFYSRASAICLLLFTDRFHQQRWRMGTARRALSHFTRQIAIPHRSMEPFKYIGSRFTLGR